jgi:hypothetical protein
MIFGQAPGQNFQIFFEVVCRNVAILFALAGVPQPHNDECKKAPVQFRRRDSSEACRLFSHAFCIFVESLLEFF